MLRVNALGEDVDDADLLTRDDIEAKGTRNKPAGGAAQLQQSGSTSASNAS